MVGVVWWSVVMLYLLRIWKACFISLNHNFFLSDENVHPLFQVLKLKSCWRGNYLNQLFPIFFSLMTPLVSVQGKLAPPSPPPPTPTPAAIYAWKQINYRINYKCVWSETFLWQKEKKEILWKRTRVICKKAKVVFTSPFFFSEF